MQQPQRSDPPRFSIREMLTGLDMPWSDELARTTAELAGLGVWRCASRLFTEEMARDLWLERNGDDRRIEDPHLLDCLRKFLASGLELGYRLSRFGKVAASLPDPDARAKNWIPFFEEVVAEEDCGTMRVFLSPALQRAIRDADTTGSEDEQSWDDMLSMMASGLFYEIGLVFRPIVFAVDRELESPWFRCEWNDLHLPAERGLGEGRLLVNDTVDRLTRLNIKGREGINPANGSECATIDESDQATAESAGLTTWDQRGYVVLCIAARIRQAAAALVNRPLYELYGLRLAESNPDLVSALEREMDPDFALQILRGLLAEEISVRDLSTILDAVLELRSTIGVDMSRYIVFQPMTGGVFADSNPRPVSELLPSDYVEFARARLRRYVSHKYTRGGNTLVVYLVDPTCEERLTQTERPDAAAEAAIMKAVREEVAKLPPTATNPVILTSMEVRRKLRDLVSPEFPHLAVLSYQELSLDMNIQPIARITPDLPPDGAAAAN